MMELLRREGKREGDQVPERDREEARVERSRGRCCPDSSHLKTEAGLASTIGRPSDSRICVE